MVTGSIIGNPGNIYGQMSTIAATIVTQLDAANGDPTLFAVKVLAEAALVLLVISLIVNVGARLLVRRVASGVALPVGAGL
jgi:phosphate transport system permease protein